MSSKFISGVIAVATAVAFVTAKPTRAEGISAQELLGLTAAVVVFGAIAHEISKDKKRKRAKVISADPPKQIHTPYAAHKPKKKKHRANHLQRLPGQCVRESYGRKARLVMPKGCLKRNEVRLRDLPTQCKTVFLNRNHVKRYGYNVGCLRQNGYRMARR
jgi:hypothetical protein